MVSGGLLVDKGVLLNKIVILGSTGSIGRQAIDIIQRHPQEFRILGLAAHSDIDTLMAQADLIKPEFICVVDEGAANQLRKDRQFTEEQPILLVGKDGLQAAATWEAADTILNAIVGGAGLASTLTGLKAGKRLALANKESLVAGGSLVKEALKCSSGTLIPVDSEHNAIWQCLVGEDRKEVSKLILTASGGPFWGRARAELDSVTAAEALAHPRWQMGQRISIDSATLLNKGLEVIEAHELFDFSYDHIDVVIHPQSIIHSMVEFIDGSFKAQLGPTDMRLPILYALSWPRRLEARLPAFDITQVGNLSLSEIEPGQAPCFDLALAAGRSGRSYPAVLNAADEIAVSAFLSGQIRFNDIGDTIARVLEIHKPSDINSVDDFIAVDGWTKEATAAFLERGALA